MRPPLAFRPGPATISRGSRIACRFDPGLIGRRVVRLHVVADLLELLRVDIPVQGLDVLRLLAVLNRVAREDDRAEKLLVARSVRRTFA